MGNILTAAFYKFVTLTEIHSLRTALQALCEKQGVKGTILLATEGINGTIAGTANEVRAVLAWLRQDTRLVDLVHKEAWAKQMPFYRMKVRIKREIVTLGVPNIDPRARVGEYVPPSEWNQLLDDPDVVLVDVRNDYEVAIGTFPGALNPKTKSFRELPAWVQSEAALRQKPKVAMFCTGGIRCEKSTALLRAQGFDKVYHLEGGILKYLEVIPKEQNRWQGECFVFDERVAVGHGLIPGKHELCRSCRYPINAVDKESPLYVQGVSCPHCHGQKTATKQQSLMERQRQVTLAKQRQQMHIGARHPQKNKPAKQ